MKFPRNARILRGQLDAAPLASVFFLLVLFVMLGSLVYTPGVTLNLPTADQLAGSDKPSIAVAVDAHGRLYFENQSVTNEAQLRERLRGAVKACPEPMVLLVQADKGASLESLLHVSLLARAAGITQASLATLPRPFQSGKQ
ncbi:MAG: hypothetical protein C5B50_17800 [Verrucomicrobia bacterium]|nr:MAG: hypothetical protein C5B50_17800 [Verrucomicrobiota bacterium]